MLWPAVSLNRRLGHGSDLSVVLANIWMNTFEDTLARVEPIRYGTIQRTTSFHVAVVVRTCRFHQRYVEDDINLMTDNEY